MKKENGMSKMTVIILIFVVVIFIIIFSKMKTSTTAANNAIKEENRVVSRRDKNEIQDRNEKREESLKKNDNQNYENMDEDINKTTYTIEEINNATNIKTSEEDISDRQFNVKMY